LGGQLPIFDSLSNVDVSLLGIFRWLGSSWLGSAIRHSQWAFAGIEMFHLLGLALLGGSLVTIGGRMLGLVMPAQPMSAVARGTLSVAILALAILVLSGVLLLADDPLRYYANVAFRTKMLLLGTALVTSLGALRLLSATGPPSPRPPPIAVRSAAVLALLSWLAVGIAGRMIGVL
jgi:hypothetical protein